MENKTIGFAMCGSFCTFSYAVAELKILLEMGYEIQPIMSETAFSTDTRFGKALDFRNEIENLTGRKIISTIVGSEPLGPKHLIEALVIAPCTGNTMAKLTNGITDTSVTMAAKSVLRVGMPVLLCPATNDALAASAQNIGRLLNTKHFFFVPLSQDDPKKKPTSLVADFTQLPIALEYAFAGIQMQPVLL